MNPLLHLLFVLTVTFNFAMTVTCLTMARRDRGPGRIGAVVVALLFISNIVLLGVLWAKVSV